MDRYASSVNEGEQLSNKLGLTHQDEINAEEAVGFLRAEQAAIDALEDDSEFTLEYLFDLHREALGHVYDFAGRLRTVNMTKGGFMFPVAEFLPEAMSQFERDYLDIINRHAWSDESQLLDHLAAMHAELLYIHAFREGNGRVARLFTDLIFLAKTGEQFDFELITKANNFERYVAAVQEATCGTHELMRALFREMRS